jgi:hypothetical protein
MAMSGFNKVCTGLSLAVGVATGGLVAFAAAKLLPNKTGFGNRTLAIGASTVATAALAASHIYGPLMVFGGYLSTAVVGSFVTFALADVAPFVEGLVQRDKGKSADYLR